MCLSLFAPPQEVGKAKIGPAIWSRHTLVEDPFNLSPDTVFQRGQPLQDFRQPAPLVDAHHKAVAGDKDRRP